MSTLSIPQSANQSISVSVTPEVSSIIFPAGFSASDASRVDNSLVLTSQDGAQVTLTDFFVVEEGGALPTLQISEGAVVSSEAFLAGVNPDMDMTTAAGPSSSPSSSGGTYSDETGDLIGGLDRLDSLTGTGQWSGNTPSSFSVAAASMPGDGGSDDLFAAIPPFITPSVVTPPAVSPVEPPVTQPVVPPPPVSYFSRSVFGGADAGSNGLDTVAINFTQTIALYDSVTGQRITSLSNADFSEFSHNYFSVTDNGDGTLTLTLTPDGLEALRGGNTALFDEFTVTDDNGTYKAQVAITPDPDLTDAELAAKFQNGDLGLQGEWVRSERLMDANIDLSNLEDGGIHIVDKGHESLMPFLNFSAAVTGATTIKGGGNDVTIEASNNGTLGLVTGVYGGNQGKVSITDVDALDITTSASQGAVSGITAMDAEIEAKALNVTVQNSALATGLAMKGSVSVDTANINVTNNMIASGMHFDGDFISTGDTNITVSADQAALGIGMGSGFELHNDRMTGESPETNITAGGTLKLDVSSNGHAAGVGNMGFAVTHPDFAKTDSTINLTAEKVDLKVTVGGSAYGVATLPSMDNGYAITNIRGDEVSIVVYGGSSATGVVAKDGGINTISGSTITISARYSIYGELGTALYAGSENHDGRATEMGSINLITGTGADDIILIDGHISADYEYTDNGNYEEVDNQNILDLGAGNDSLRITGDVTGYGGQNIINMGEGRDTLTIDGRVERAFITDKGDQGGEINLNGGVSLSGGYTTESGKYVKGNYIHADTSDISIKSGNSWTALSASGSDVSVKTGGNISIEGSRGIHAYSGNFEVSGKYVEIDTSSTSVYSEYGNVTITGVAVVIKCASTGLSAIYSEYGSTTTIKGTDGADIIKVQGDIMAASGGSWGYNKNIISTGAGDDIIVLKSRVFGNFEIDGGAGNDTLILLADDWSDFTIKYEYMFRNGTITSIESIEYMVNNTSGSMPQWFSNYCASQGIMPVAVDQTRLDGIDNDIASIRDDKPAESIGVTEEALPDVNPETPATTPSGPEVTNPGVSGAVIGAVRDQTLNLIEDTTIVADKMASDFNYVAGVWDATIDGAANNLTINAGQSMTTPVYGSIAAGIYSSHGKETAVRGNDITINAVGHSANGIVSTVDANDPLNIKVLDVTANNDLTINATGYIAAGVASYAASIKAGNDITINVDADMAGGRASGAMFAGGMGAENNITLTVKAEQEAIGLTVVRGNPYQTVENDGVVQAKGSIKVDVESEKGLAAGISLMTGTGLYLDTDLESTIKAQNTIDVLVKSGDRAQGVSALTSLDTSHSATIDMQAGGKITVAAEGSTDYASAFGLFASGPGAHINVAAPAVEISATTVYGWAYGVYSSNGGTTTITGNQITIWAMHSDEYGYAIQAAGEGSSNTVNGTGLDDIILITGSIRSGGINSGYYDTSSNTISTYGGNDLVSISKGTVSGNIHVDLGAGDDTLRFTDATIYDGTYLLGDGKNLLDMKNSYVAYSVNVTMGDNDDILRVEQNTNDSKEFYGTVDMGNGDNTATFSSSAFGGQITTGNGSDTVSFTSSNLFSGNLDTGAGNDSISLDRSSINSVTINMGEGNDTLTMTDSKFSYGTINMGDGDDSISMTGTTISPYSATYYPARLDAGEGNDTLTLDSVIVSNRYNDKINLDMGEGADKVEFAGNMDITSNNAFLHGGDGIDTLDLSGLTGWKFNNAESDVKLSQLAKVADSFEVIDLTGGSGTDLVIDTLLGDFVGDKIEYDATKIDATDIAGLESLWNGAEKVLVVNRDQDDTVNVDTSVWQDKGSVEYNGVIYNAYASSDEAQMILIQSQL